MATAGTPPTTTTRLLTPELRRDSIARERILSALAAAAAHPLTVISAPAGYGKTTALVQWLEQSGSEHAWLSLDLHDNDPRWFVARLLATLDRALPGEMEAAERGLGAGADLRTTVIPLAVNALARRSGPPLAIALDDYHLISDTTCHELTVQLVDAIPAGAHVIVASRTPPPLRLGRRRAAGTLAEVGPQDLRFELEETERLLNGSLDLGLDRSQLQEIDARVHGWAAGLALIAAALVGRQDRDGLLTAMAASQASFDDYLVEEVLDAAGPELRRFLRRTSILERLHASLCEAVLDDPRARELLDEVRRMNLFVTALDPEETWFRYHQLFAATLAGQLERREPHVVGQLHRRASAWFQDAGMTDEALEHALAAGDGPRAASILADSWLDLIGDRRYATVRRTLERLPDDRGAFGPLCQALDLLCLIYEGVDQRLVCERAEALAEQHGDDPRVRLLVDSMLITPFAGDIGRAAAIGRAAWERYADAPEVQQELVGPYALVLWFAGEYDDVRTLLEPRVRLEQPTVTKVWTWSILALTAADEGDGEVAERYAREAMAEVERVGGETATEFTGVPAVLAEALRLRGKLEEARHHLSRALQAEAERPGSIGHAMALAFDAELSLAEGDPRRAETSARRAREIVDRYPDLGTLETRVAAIEATLHGSAQNMLLGTEVSPAEQRVLELLDSHRTLAEIAAELFVSRDTVKSHARRLYRRLGQSTRQGALTAARARGLLGDQPDAR